MLNVFTAQFRYGGADRFDITSKTKTAWSPPWWLVQAYQDGNIDEKLYTEKYNAFLEQSLEIRKAEWDELLQRDEVTLVCYCRANKFCHRLLAARALEKLGARYYGER